MKKKRSVCPIACALDILGDKWTLLIIRDFFAGKQKYSEFLQSPEKISTNILSARLKELVEAGVIVQSRKSKETGKATYALSEMGNALYPLLESVANWSLEHIKGTEKIIAVK